MIKFISILLILVACLGLVSGVLDLNEFLSNSDGGSSNVQTPSDVTPDPDSPSEPDVTPVTFNVTNWHTEEHGSLLSVGSPCSDCGLIFNEDDPSLSAAWEEGCSWAYLRSYNCPCMGNVQFLDTHCFVNGTCHDCGGSCGHIASYLDVDYLEVLPEDHPIRHNYSYNDGYYYDVDNDEYCDLCGMYIY